MKLEQLFGTYDAIFSLGENCLPPIQLVKAGIRPYAGPLDWMLSVHLPDVTRLIHNRCNGYMELSNLRFEIVSNAKWMVRDLAYNIVSSHDFPQSLNTPHNPISYPVFKEKMNRRSARFLEQCASHKRILFIRSEGQFGVHSSFEQVTELQEALSRVVQHDFSILLIRHGNVPALADDDWPLEKVCAVTMPMVADLSTGNDAYWGWILHRTVYEPL